MDVPVAVHPAVDPHAAWQWAAASEGLLSLLCPRPGRHRCRLVQTLIELAIYATILLILGNVGTAWLAFPLWFVLFIVFVASSSIALSVINIYYRDVAHLVGVALQLIFFLTPIIYTLDMVPADWHGIPLQQIILLNPVTQFVVSFRTMSYGLELPPLTLWLGLIAWTAAALVLATLAYRRWGLDVGEAA